MQNAVINFAKSKENGLCLIDMPTGTGKTYQTRCLIKKYIEGKELTNIPLIIYLTPLRKNVDEIYYELRNDFEDKEKFDNNVLRLKSYSDCVLENFLDVRNKIPQSLQRKESFKNLEAKIKRIKENKNGSLYSIELKELKDYETRFRRDLESEINKEAKGKAKKKELINNSYSWVKKLYPSCLTEDRKVLFMTMDKFLYGNDPIISKPYRFLSYSKVKNSLIFIDEFDSTKDVILKEEIQKCTDYKIDLVKLFSGVSLALKGKQMPTSMFANSDTSNEALKEMSKKFLEIEKQYNLDYIFKLESQDDIERFFLFDDFRIHTIGGNDKENSISSINDQKKKQNTLKVGSKENEKFYQTIYGMKYAVNSFIFCCATMASEYLDNYNKIARSRKKDIMEIEQAVSSIVDLFNLDNNLKETVSSLIVDNIALPLGTKTRDIFSTDFYMNGFRYFDLNDDISHDCSTSLSMCYLYNTPEKFMISLTNKARVVGLSATATLNSVTSNYDLDYIKKKIDDYYELPINDKENIRKYVSSKLSCNYNINAEKILISKGKDPDSIANNIFTKKENIEKFSNLLLHTVDDNAVDPNYNNYRFAKILISIKKFLEIKTSKVLLVLANRIVRKDKSLEPYCEDNLNTAITLMCNELNINMPKLHFLYGENFEEQKSDYKKEVNLGEKVILFSSYPSVGTGQNLQYEIDDDEEELKNEKDIDSLYIEFPTNIIVHTNYLTDECALNKYIYQMEALKFNGEIDPSLAIRHIKFGFKKFISPLVHMNIADKNLYQCDSINNHRIKILVQAVGRICRTDARKKKHDVNIFIDDDIISKVNFNILKGRLLNPEFTKVMELSKFVPEYDYEAIKILNRAKDADDRVATRLGNILSKNKIEWNEKDIQQWNLIRDFVLKHPTISREDLKKYAKEPGLSSIEDFYLFNKEGRKLNCYIYSNKDKKKKILFGDNPNQANDEILINEQNSRLTISMKNSVIRKHFEDNGYATSFIENDGMILPIVFQNIYKGAIGEQAGVATLKDQGIKLALIEDPKKFEKFDFCYGKNKDIYFDFKNWSENDKEDRFINDEKVEDKLKKVSGKKAFIINLFSSRFEIHDRGNVVEISSLYGDSKSNFQLNMKDMYRVVSKILEAAKDGN